MVNPFEFRPAINLQCFLTCFHMILMAQVGRSNTFRDRSVYFCVAPATGMFNLALFFSGELQDVITALVILMCFCLISRRV